MQNKPKKNLYGIIFLVIMLSFIISLTGCDWFSNGLFNIFDPKAQIIAEFNPVEGGEPADGCCNAGVYCINEVEFNITGFAYNYHGVDSVDGRIEISELSRVMEASFYVAPSTSPGTPGPKTIIENIPLFFQDVVDYLYLHPFITEITCDLSLVGVDGAGHNLSFQIASELPIFQPGIDLYPPYTEISVTPGATGTAPFAVVFDASNSYDLESGIADINWDFGDETTGTDITESHTYATPGSYSVTLTVTDFYGNKGYATVIITVNEAEAPTAIINTTPDPPTGIAPFKVYFDAYESYADPACGFGCEIVSYEWEFGDGDIGTGVTLNHTYSNVGTYTVVLTVADSNGKKGYANLPITVTKEPTAVITTVPDPPTGVAPFIVYFDAYESTSESGIVSYEWEFGDGDTGDGITVNHTYDTAGTYIVYLTITDYNGYEAYASVKITVESESVANGDIVYRALLVGVGDYENLPDYYPDADETTDLLGPPYDVDRIRQTLEQCRFGSSDTEFSIISELKDLNATKTAILSGINSNFSGADDNDISYFYFSGHGSYTGDYVTSYICPTNANDTVDSLISVDELEIALSAIPGTKVVILNSCHSGGFIGKGKGEIIISKEELTSFNDEIINVFSQSQSKDILTTNQYKVLTSCHCDQTCFEIISPPHTVDGNPYGVFTAAFCRGCGYDDGTYYADEDSNTKVNLNEAYVFIDEWIDILNEYRISIGLEPILQDVQIYPSGSTFTIVEY